MKFVFIAKHRTIWPVAWLCEAMGTAGCDRRDIAGHRQLRRRLQPVFDAIVANADRLIGGFSTAVYRFVGSMWHLATFTPINPAADELLKSRFPCPIAGRPDFALAQAGETVEIPDTEVQPDLPLTVTARARGIRMSKGTAIVAS